MAAAKKLYRTFKNEGLSSAVSRVVGHLSWLHDHWVIGTYYVFKGAVRISVEDVSAVFKTETRSKAVAVRFFCENEIPFLKDMLTELRPTDVFFDVGANIGLYTCLVADSLPNGSVVAFEPYPPNNRSLRENLERNSLDVQVESVALSNEEGTVEFDLFDDEATRGTPTIATRGGLSTVHVRSDTIDGLVENGTIPAPQVVKIDVEGAEPLVIMGMQNTLESGNCRTVYCEIHLPSFHRTSIDDFGSSYEEIREIFASCGFEVSELYRRPDEVMIKASKEEPESDGKSD